MKININFKVKIIYLIFISLKKRKELGQEYL